MSGYSHRGGFILTWNIENFAFNGMRKGERIKTPCFYAYSCSSLLMLYPRGNDDSNYIALEYHRHPDGKKFDFLYSILDSEGSPLMWKEEKNADSKLKPINLVRCDEVFGPRKTTFLPNNTLTIQCRIVKKGEAFSTPLLLNLKSRFQDNRSFLQWKIPNFYDFAPRKPILSQFPKMTQYDSCLKFILYLDDEERYKFRIEYIKVNALDWAFATCKVEALYGKEQKIKFAESEHFFDSNNKVWQFTPYITKSMLMCDQNLFMPNGTLTLMLECTLSSGVDYSRVDDSKTTSENQEAASAAQTSSSTTVDKYLHESTYVHGPSETLSRDLLRLYETGILSDFYLSVADVKFPVHKQVLSARSPEFEAMFTVDKAAIESKGIEIQDIDINTLQRLIRFIYTDAVPGDLEWNEICKLYVAAEKYKLQSLKDKCSAFLKSSVCLLNVCEILVFADLHEEEDLKSATLDFIMQNDTQVIGTEPWKKLEKENAQLCFETFRAMYLKKMDKE